MKHMRMFVGFCLLMIAVNLLACSRARQSGAAVARLTGGGNAAKGPGLVRYYGCGGCHTIRGVTGAVGLVGPPLTGIGERGYIAGTLPNTPSNLMAWIRHPHSFQPNTVMPEMNVTEEDSRDIAAFLYTLY